MRYAALAAVLIAGGCASSSATDPADTSTEDELPAVFQRYAGTVNVAVDGEYVVLRSSGVPDHRSPYFAAGDTRYEAYNGTNTRFVLNPNRIATQSIVARIPLRPVAATTPQATALGIIGVALNGVPFFNQYAGPNRPLTNEIDSFDQYNGHPQQSGVYHYHVEPLSLTARYGGTSLLGFLLDGYPVYGPVENGRRVVNADLDALHGHSHATTEFPAGTYHYHITDQDPYLNGAGYYGRPGTVAQ
jgi:hypothetical protein